MRMHVIVTYRCIKYTRLLRAYPNIPQYSFCNLSEHNTSRAEQGAAQQTTAQHTARLSRHDKEGSTAFLTSGFAAVCVICRNSPSGRYASERWDIFQPSRGDPDMTTRNRDALARHRRKEPRDRWATLRNLFGIDIIYIMYIRHQFRWDLNTVPLRFFRGSA
jgi:hypothetical protein